MARSPGSGGTAPCASHETFCRVAVYTGQPAGIHTRPASRGTRRATAVKPRPSRMSSYAPARIARSLGSRGTAPSASHETFCRVAVCTGQPAGIHTRPASRGTRRATAVKPRPSRMSSYAPARIARSLGSRGTAPSASHETFCRVAVCTGQPAGIHTRPASRGTRRATAVKPRPSRMSPYTPARPWRAVRGQGYYP